MKKITFYSLVFIASLCFTACKTGGSNTDEKASKKSTEAERVKDVSELSVMDLFALIYPDSTGTPLEWHGEALPNNLADSLQISEGEPCGDKGCGKQLLLTNNATRAVGLMTKADFSIRDRQAYLACKFEMDPGQTISIGCSHLCYNGEAFPFTRTIVGSWYLDE